MKVLKAPISLRKCLVTLKLHFVRWLYFGTAMVALKKFVKQLRLYLTAAAVLLGGLSTGLVVGYSSPTIPKMTEPSSSIRLNEEDVSWFGSLMALGALFGGVCCGYLSDKFGRKGTIFFTCIPMTLGWLLIAYAPSILALFIGRTLTGIGAGIMNVAVSTYLVEISTPSTRGLFGVSFQTLCGLGVLGCAAIGMTVSWSLLAIICALPVILTMTFVSLVPESPLWLKAHNQLERAYIAALRLYGKGSEMLQPFTIHHTTSEAQSKVPAESEQHKKNTFTLATLKDREVFIPGIYGFTIFFLQQFSGINPVTFNSVSIFEAADPSTNPFTTAIKMIACGQAGLFVNTPLVDRLGRKILLIASTIGQMIGMLACGVYFYLVDTKGEAFQQDYGWMAFASISFYVFFYSLGFGPIPLVLIPEMVPQRARSFITGSAMAFSWAMAFVVSKTFHLLGRTFTPCGPYFFYGLMSLVATIFIICCIPETKGQTLESIEQHFMKNPKPNTNNSGDVPEHPQPEKAESQSTQF